MWNVVPLSCSVDKTGVDTLGLSWAETAILLAKNIGYSFVYSYDPRLDRMNNSTSVLTLRQLKKKKNMSTNPSTGRGGAGVHSKRQFAESNPHTLVGLQKVKVQLEKEISKLDKQQTTAVTNIANHQQAMKMTWRLLQQRRMVESPLLSRSKQDSEDAIEPGMRRGLFHSKTKLYVRNTPNIYHPETKGGGENLPRSSASMLKDAAPPTNSEQGKPIPMSMLLYERNAEYKQRIIK